MTSGDKSPQGWVRNRMSETSTSEDAGRDASRDTHEDALTERVRLSFDLDVDICVVGAGLAGLTTALCAARQGASVAVLEGRQVGWNASGHLLGTVMPGFGLALPDLIERVGLDDAKALWALSWEGAEFVRGQATEELMPGIAPSEGCLEVSNVDAGDTLIRHLQMLGEEFDTQVEGWQVERVRDQLRTDRYFHGIYYPKAFQIDGRRYVHALARLARRAGARIFEDTPVVSIDATGIRKRIVTPSARLRANHIVLAGNTHLGAPLRRLSDTLLPVWRFGGITAPLGDRLAEAVRFPGSVADSDGIDQFRIVGGDRLMWVSPETTWNARPPGFVPALQRRLRGIFPQLGTAEFVETFGGATGQTVHGMPQVGQLRKGLWVASGFGRQGLATSAMAGQLVARGILGGDDRWQLFSPFELVWAGGATGRVAGYAVSLWTRGQSAVAGSLARHRERAQAQERIREARSAEAKQEARRQAAQRSSAPRRPPQGQAQGQAQAQAQAQGQGQDRPLRPRPEEFTERGEG